MQRREFLASSLAQLPNPASLLPHIRKSRDAALAILKPSERDLQHGLELHASSLVIEPYGFSPRSAYNGDTLRAAIEAGASDMEIQDLTEDMMHTRCVEDAAQRLEYQQAWEASGVTCVVQNAGEETQDPQRLIKRLAQFTYVTDMLGGFVARAAKPADIVAARQAGKHCIYLSGNGVPLTQQWDCLRDELLYIRVFFELGIRMMHLTYNRRNLIGDGCGEAANGGLSDFGRAVVAEMNRVGVIVDVAHCGWQTSLEAARLSNRPMVASHASCAGVFRHIRSKPDEVIRAICDSGGFIGICAVPDFLGGTGDIAAMLNHIDYAVKRFGAGHVAIATDNAYVSVATDGESRKVPRGQHHRRSWEALWPPGSRKLPLWHPTTSWTNWPLFTVGLVQRGYSDADIQKILGGNALRVATLSP